MGPMFRTKRASWQISSVFCREGTMSTGVHCPKINWILCRKKMNHLRRGADAWLTSGFWTRSIYWTPCHPQPAMRSLMQTFRLFLGQCVHLVMRNQL